MGTLPRHEHGSLLAWRRKFCTLPIMNNVHELENQMIRHLLSFSTALLLTTSLAMAGTSTRHSAQASAHSGAAASHGSAAVLSGTATVSAVPLMAVGATLSLSGAALQSAGTSALTLGSQLIEAPRDPVHALPTPDGPPRLDQMADHK